MSTALEPQCVAILSPGDMGHAIGRALREHGLDVLTCLDGRSERTRRLTLKAGIREVASYEGLAREADVVLSILVPAKAVTAAQRIAATIQATGSHPFVADCNAVSPQTAQAIDEIITSAGGRFIDASIIGFPPRAGITPRVYASGPHASVLSALNGKGIEVVVMRGDNGHASAIKMCYAGLTKGTFALYYAVTLAAEKMGLFDELCREFEHSQPEVLARMQQHLPRLPAKASRWIAEMEEIAETFRQAGVTPQFHEAAADIFRLVSQTPLARDTPETIDERRTLKETIAAISSLA